MTRRLNTVPARLWRRCVVGLKLIWSVRRDVAFRTSKICLPELLAWWLKFSDAERKILADWCGLTRHVFLNKLFFCHFAYVTDINVHLLRVRAWCCNGDRSTDRHITLKKKYVFFFFFLHFVTVNTWHTEKCNSISLRMSRDSFIRWGGAGFSPQIPEFRPALHNVTFMVDELALVHVYSRDLRLSLSVSVHKHFTYIHSFISDKVKVKFAIEQTMKPQWESRGIVLLFL
jgi:hypothetical protein